MPRNWWATIVLMAALLVSAETVSRFLMAPIGDNLWAYGAAGFSRPFEWYRYLAENDATPEVVAVGDSIGARNFDPFAFADASGVENVYSLARAGNFPLALRSNTLPLLAYGKPPEVVVLLQWPGSLRDDSRVGQIEAGALSPILEARRAGRIIVTDYFYVSRLFPARKYLASYWIHGEELLYPPKNLGFSPFGETVSRTTEDTPTETFIQDAVFSEERRSVTRELVDLASERGFLVIAVVGPYRAGTRYTVANQHLEWLRALESSACGSLEVVDLRHAPFLETFQFKDNHHLYADGAALFSAKLADIVDRLREEPRRMPVDCDTRQNAGL